MSVMVFKVDWSLLIVCLNNECTALIHIFLLSDYFVVFMRIVTVLLNNF